MGGLGSSNRIKRNLQGLPLEKDEAGDYWFQAPKGSGKQGWFRDIPAEPKSNQQPSQLGLQQRPEPTPYPERPQYEAPEGYDLRKALKSGVEAGLTTSEFNGVLNQLGMVNKEEQAQALSDFERVMGDYQDQFGRVGMEREEQAAIGAGLEEKRRYGLSLAKEARAESREIEKTAGEALKADRQYALDVHKHAAGLTGPTTKKWAGSKEAAEYERGTKMGVAGLKKKETKKAGFSYQQQVKFNQDRSKAIQLQLEQGAYENPDKERLAKNQLVEEYNLENLPNYEPRKDVAVAMGVNKKTGEIGYRNFYGKVFTDEKCTKPAGKSFDKPALSKEKGKKKPKTKKEEKRVKGHIPGTPSYRIKKAKETAKEALKLPGKALKYLDEDALRRLREQGKI